MTKCDRDHRDQRDQRDQSDDSDNDADSDFSSVPQVSQVSKISSVSFLAVSWGRQRGCGAHDPCLSLEGSVGSHKQQRGHLAMSSLCFS